MGVVAISSNSDVSSFTQEASPQSKKQATASGLTPEEQALVTKLAQRDREVRAHEAAHMAAAGPYISGSPTFTYQTGPDGKRYAIGGEVGIDTGPENNPEDTIRKAQVIRAAALAPADPSAQDLAVAGAASNMEAQARIELQTEKRAKAEESNKTESASSPALPSNHIDEPSEDENIAIDAPEKNKDEILHVLKSPHLETCPQCLLAFFKVGGENSPAANRLNLIA
jgi:hypothetical protein